MLIKNKTRKGDPIPYSAEEALPFAIERGARSKNDSKQIFWVEKGTVKKVSFSFLDNPVDGKWEAKAEGSANIGYTDVKTDKFFKAKPYSFVIVYKSSKDNLGLPDISIVSMEMKPLEQNPKKLMGFPTITVEPKKAKEAPAEKVVAPKPEVVAAKK
jgi:hypothetical protein